MSPRPPRFTNLLFDWSFQSNNEIEWFLVSLAAIVQAAVEAGEFTVELTVLTAFCNTKHNH